MDCKDCKKLDELRQKAAWVSVPNIMIDMENAAENGVINVRDVEAILSKFNTDRKPDIDIKQLFRHKNYPILIHLLPKIYRDDDVEAIILCDFAKDNISDSKIPGDRVYIPRDFFENFYVPYKQVESIDTLSKRKDLLIEISIRAMQGILSNQCLRIRTSWDRAYLRGLAERSFEIAKVMIEQIDKEAGNI